MSVVVRPFRGLLAPPALTPDIICPPYDVVNREEATRLAELRPKCLLRINRPEIELPGVEPTDPAVYKRGADNLQKWIHEGLLVKEDKPGFYAYRQTLGKHVQHGIFALVSCEQYKAGIIKKHELTRKAPEEDRTTTLRTQNANIGSVFLAFKDAANAALTEYIRRLCAGEPDRQAHLDFDNTDHALWIVNDEKRVTEIEAMFGELPALYIADGHHRAASAFNIYSERKEAAGASFKGDEPYCFFMAAIFAASELCIIDYNRVVRGLADPTEQFLGKLKDQGYEVSPMKGDERPNTPSFLEFHYARPDQGRTFSLFLRGKWYKMVLTRALESDSPVDAIESQILTKTVLTPLFGITDLRSAKNISFIGGTRGLKALEEAAQSEDSLAFAVPPVTMENLFAVADRNEIMPPKSTWFVPKLATGVVSRLID